MTERPAPAAVRHVSLRTATGDDLAGISALERVAFADPWSEASFAGLLSGSHVRITVAVEDDAVCGYSVLLLAPPDADLANLAVVPRLWGQGIGQRLVREAIATARATGTRHIYLEVRQSNARAIRMYESAGFEQVGTRRRYYREPVEDARVLRLELSAE